MISVKKLTKRYGHVTAIENVTFEVQKGEVLGFLGPNGAGKTTTMRILTGFMPASGGTAHVAGFDIFEQNREVKKRIGYLPENPPIYPELTVQEYLRFVARIKGIPRKKIKPSLEKTLEQCALGEVRGRLIGNLSKGYRQRVGLAQALIHDPEVLILDEPTTGLDPKQIIEMRKVIRELSGQHTVILSTHILSEATAICQRVVIIHEGRIVAVDSPERLSSQLNKSEKIRVGLRTPGKETEAILQKISGVLSVFPEKEKDGTVFYTVECEQGRDIRTELASLAVRSSWGILELQTVTLSLEDVFLKLTREDRGETSRETELNASNSKAADSHTENSNSPDTPPPGSGITPGDKA